MNIDMECREECLKKDSNISLLQLLFLIYQLFTTDTIFVDTLHL